MADDAPMGEATGAGDAGKNAEDDVFGDSSASLDAELAGMTVSEIRQRTRYVEDEISMFQSQINQIDYESKMQAAKVKEGKERVKLNMQLPWLVSNVVEVRCFRP